MNFTFSRVYWPFKMKVIIGLWILMSEQPYKSSCHTTSSHFSHFAWPIGQFSKSLTLLTLNHWIIENTRTHLLSRWLCFRGFYLCPLSSNEGHNSKLPPKVIRQATSRSAFTQFKALHSVYWSIL